MKKAYDWSVRLRVTLTNNQRLVELAASVHTSIHQLALQIAKALALPLLDTHIDIYAAGLGPLKPLSTLLQNELTRDSSLTATVTRTKSPGGLEPRGEKEGGLGEVGLSVVSSCTNPGCVDYGQQFELHYGMGRFSLLGLTAGAKCEVCPYKSQFLRPSMMCHRMKVSFCLYKLQGSSFNSRGIPVPKSTGFLRARQGKEILALVGRERWEGEAVLEVRPI